MSIIVVLFHNTGDDRAQELNVCLEKKGGFVDQDQPVQSIAFADGHLFICLDGIEFVGKFQETAERQIRQSGAIKDDEEKILLRHRQTDISFREKQGHLMQPGGLLEGAQSYLYSHVLGDPIYKALVDLLQAEAGRLAHFLLNLSGVSLRSQISIVKHQLSHIFLPLDIDLQGLLESQFKPEYWEEVKQVYQGRGASILDKARGLVYGRVGETLQQAVEKAKELFPKQMQPINEAWGIVQKWLPPTTDLPNGSVKDILIALSEGSLESLKRATSGTGNSFHELHANLINALDGLQDVIARAESQGDSDEVAGARTS